jgi:hypothetical protein
MVQYAEISSENNKLQYQNLNKLFVGLHFIMHFWQSMRFKRHVVTRNKGLWKGIKCAVCPDEYQGSCSQWIFIRECTYYSRPKVQSKPFSLHTRLATQGQLRHQQKNRWIHKQIHTTFIHLVFCLTTAPPKRSIQHSVWRQVQSLLWNGSST